MKTCACQNCGHVFVSKRIRPFCNNTCRHTFMANNPLPAILIGANTNDQTRHTKTIE